MMTDLSALKDELLELRDTLRTIANVYNTLCLYLREVYTLADLVGSDYYDLQKPSKEMTKRLEKWRSLERNIFYTLSRHSETQFVPYTHYEAMFMEKLRKSADTLIAKRDCAVKLKARRFKEGIIAVKCATEAKRRSDNIAEFIAEVKNVTHRDPSDYLDNMIILQALTLWTKEVVRDCVRSTASSSDKFTCEESNGQIIYTNEVIRSIVDYAEASTVVTRAPSSTLVTQLVEHILDGSTTTDSATTPSSRIHGVNASHITYYLYNLVHNLQNENNFASDALKPLLKTFEGLDVPLSISTPYHLYQIQEYFSNLAKSNEFLELIHSSQQMLLKNASLCFASDINGCIERIVSKKDLGTMDIRPILIALRASKYLSAPEKKKLLGIWDKPPFVT